MATAPRGRGNGNAARSNPVVRRILIGIFLFVTLTVLALLLPRAMPGELPGAELTPHSDLPCRACPPPEQITRAGLAAAINGWYLNVQLASPPAGTILRIAFDGVPGEIALQRSTQSWRYLHPLPAGMPAITSVAERDNRVVFGLPLALRPRGFSVSTGSGDRIPATGFIPPTYPAPAHFNAADIVLLAILAVTAWYGYRRGFLVELSDLMAIAAGLVAAVLGQRPLAALLAPVVGSPVGANVLASGLLLLGVSLACMFLLAGLRGRFTGSLEAPLNGLLGGVTGCLRQLPLLALLLAAGSNLAILHWAAPSIQSSAFGTALLHAWNSVFAFA
jgi:uncharacterized membrane protein required for colicin V production